MKSLLHLFLCGELLGIARLFNRDEIFVVFISSGLNVYPACPVKHEAGLSEVKSLLHLFLWGEPLGIARLFNRDGIFVAFIPSG